MNSQMKWYIGRVLEGPQMQQLLPSPALWPSRLLHSREVWNVPPSQNVDVFLLTNPAL